MRRIDFKVDLFTTPEERVASEHVMLKLLSGLCLANLYFLRAHPDCPGIYESGVRYQREPPGQEEWQDVPNMLRSGNGDCEDLACWRVAELRISGVKARPHLTYRKVGDTFRYHVTVRHSDGRIEDPSLTLGMRGPD